MDDLIKKKYKPMENVLNTVNSYIAIQDGERKRNNKILDQVTRLMQDKMKQKDLLFTGMFDRNFYGGSFYDNLKVDNPNEFDLDFILKIPKIVEPKVRCSDQPGFTQVELTAYKKMLTRAEKPRFEKISNLLDDANFLSTTKVLKWMESLFDSAFKDLSKTPAGNAYIDVFVDPNNPKDPIRVYATLSKGAPAFTMKLIGKNKDEDIQLDIDLVPCFQFSEDQWPDASEGYRPNTNKKRTHFLIVPKKPKGGGIENSSTLERYWRLSFQEQERDMINGDHLKFLKPSLRLLKKLKDKHNHKIASYFIKTVFLWTLDQEKDDKFWAQPLSFVFMTMLKKYADQVKEKNIPYYWNKNNNLIECLKDSTKVGIANTLRNIIDNVEKSLTEPFCDPFVIGKYLLSQSEYQKLRGQVILGKKLEKSISITSNNANNTSLTVDTADSSKNEPPLKKLGFGDEHIRIVTAFLTAYEERQKQDLNSVMSTISAKNAKENEDVLAYLRRIDEKVDYISEKIDKIHVNNERNGKRMDNLDRRIRQLTLGDGAINGVGEGGSGNVDTV